MTGQDALWSALEVRTQAEQCAGQVTVWEALGIGCEGCGAEPDEPCRWGCLSHEHPHVTPSNVEVTR